MRTEAEVREFLDLLDRETRAADATEAAARRRLTGLMTQQRALTEQVRCTLGWALDIPALGVASRIWIESARKRRAEAMSKSGKYGIITTTGKALHPDEPVFLLRATDPLAPAAIKAYAQQCMYAGCDNAHVIAVLEHEDAVRRWQADNPSLVKKKPD